MATEHDDLGRKYSALYMGVVVDNADPEKLGRVKLRIPGLVDPESAWALPLGLGGGAKERGMFWPPDVGADVGVMFVMGDVDHPAYLGGHWGRPNGVREVPGPVGRDDDISAADAHKVKSIETDRYEIVIDDRAGKESLRFRDKVTDDSIEMDGAGKGIVISATAALVIKAVGAVSIDAPLLTLNKRPVSPGSGPI